MEKQVVTDIQLWARFKEGDNNALAEIYASNSKKLYWYGLSFTKNDSLIEDAIQDLFSELIASRKNLSSTNNIQFYLLKSFKRILQRKIKKEKKFLLPDDQIYYNFEVTHSVEYFIVKEEKYKQKLTLLHEAIKLLTSRQREVIYLKFSENLSYEEIAEIMDMTVESCRNLMCKAIRSLKNSLSEKDTFSLLYLTRVNKKESSPHHS